MLWNHYSKQRTSKFLTILPTAISIATGLDIKTSSSGAIILDLLKQQRASKVLNDNTLVTGPWKDAAEWTATVWFPDMIEAGLRHFAWIFSPNLFAELSAKMAMPASDIVKSFNGLEEARQWLINVKPSTEVKA